MASRLVRVSAGAATLINRRSPQAFVGTAIASSSSTFDCGAGAASDAGRGTGVHASRQAPATTMQTRNITGWINDKMLQRSKNQQAEQLQKQIDLMSNAEIWTLKHFADEIDTTLNSWSNKMLGGLQKNSKEQVKAKLNQAVATGLVEQLGGETSAAEAINMDRKSKLKLAISCKKSIEDVNSVISDIQNMEIMHRILRYRKENGTQLPSDQEGLKLAMMQDGTKVMTEKEKAAMKEAYMKQQGGGRR